MTTYTELNCLRFSLLETEEALTAETQRLREATAACAALEALEKVLRQKIADLEPKAPSDQ